MGRAHLLLLLAALPQFVNAEVMFMTPQGMMKTDTTGATPTAVPVGARGTYDMIGGMMVDDAAGEVYWISHPAGSATKAEVWKLPTSADASTAPTLVTSVAGLRGVDLAVHAGSETLYILGEDGGSVRVRYVENYKSAAGATAETQNSMGMREHSGEGMSLVISGDTALLFAKKDADPPFITEYSGMPSPKSPTTVDLDTINPDSYAGFMIPSGDGNFYVGTSEDGTDGWPGHVIKVSPAGSVVEEKTGVLPKFSTDRTVTSQDNGPSPPNLVVEDTGNLLVCSSTAITDLATGSTVYEDAAGVFGPCAFTSSSPPPPTPKPQVVTGAPAPVTTGAPAPVTTGAPTPAQPATSSPGQPVTSAPGPGPNPPDATPQPGPPPVAPVTQQPAPVVPPTGGTPATPTPQLAAAPSPDEEEDNTLTLVLAICLAVIALCLIAAIIYIVKARKDDKQDMTQQQNRRDEAFKSLLAEQQEKSDKALASQRAQQEELMRMLESQKEKEAVVPAVPSAPTVDPQPVDDIPPEDPLFSGERVLYESKHAGGGGGGVEGSPSKEVISVGELPESPTGTEGSAYPLVYWPGLQSASTPRAVVRGVEAPSTSPLHHRIVSMYETYNPSKKHTIEPLIKKYGEEALLKTLIDKYGPEPNESGGLQPHFSGSLSPRAGPVLSTAGSPLESTAAASPVKEVVVAD